MRGSDIVLQIPNSGSLFRIPTYLSWNTFGMIQWSDGLRDPNYDAPVFARHPGTGELVWPKLCKEVRREEFSLFTYRQIEESPIPYLQTPSLGDFERTDDKGVFPDEAHETGFRIGYWWVANEPQRDGKPRVISDQRFRQNLERLLAIIPARTGGREWMEIEIARELGDFERALSLLDQIPNADSSVVGRCLRKLVAVRNSKVAVLAP